MTRRDFLRLCATSGFMAIFGLLPGSQKKAPDASGDLEVISREAWGALPPDPNAPSERGSYDPAANPDGWRVYSKPLPDVLHTVVVHHTATYASPNPRRVQAWHRNKLGLADVGYHFLLDPQGRIYAGRDVQVRGAHTGGHNTGALGVALMGHHELWPPTGVAVTQLRRLIEPLTRAYRLTHVAGHRDLQPGATVCPGQYLMLELPRTARATGLTYGGGGFSGSAQTHPIQ